MQLINGDSLEKLKILGDSSIDAIVTDPPYELGFMGKSWDKTGIANNVELWKECLRVLKPGGHLLAFSGTRTYHRMAVAIEDAGFEVRDMIEWVYGSGFPKSLNIGKAVDKLNGRSVETCQEIGRHIKEKRVEAGYTLKQMNTIFGYVAGCNWWESQNDNNTRLIRLEDWHKLVGLIGVNEKYTPIIERIEKERTIIGKNKNWGELSGVVPFTGGKEWDVTKGTSEWEGWGTALKPAHEPICMARKPLAEKTVAENCLKYGTGGINIDESRVEGIPPSVPQPQLGVKKAEIYNFATGQGRNGEMSNSTLGRFPANLIHDNSEEVIACFPETKSGGGDKGNVKDGTGMFGSGKAFGTPIVEADSGNASRFFKSIIYQAKASKSERNRGCEELEEKEGIRANNHPTVKPVALMEYLITMVTPKDGVVLDPFMGSGTTGVACAKLNRDFIGIELSEEYIKIADARIRAAKKMQMEII